MEKNNIMTMQSMAMQPLVKETKKLPELIKASGSYDLYIPGHVQQKIDYLCNKVHDVEWSGTLFYTTSGEFDAKEEKDRLKVSVIDFFVQDIGSAAYTEFSQSPDLASYMVEHNELLDENVFMGLIHSHNNMSTFFSGTDTNTLRQEGAEQNHFVSLIVNNFRKYTAGITRKIISEQTISENISYRSFFDKIINSNRNKKVSIETIEWFDLDIHSELGFDVDEVDARLKEIEENKKKPYQSGRKNNDFLKYCPSKGDFNDFLKKEEATQLAFDDFNIKEKANDIKLDDFEEQFEGDIPYGKVHFDEDMIDDITKQIVTGSILLRGNSKFDLEKFVKTSKGLFDKRFESMMEYSSWAEGHIDHLITTAFDPKLEKYGEDAMMSLCAFDVRENLKKLPTNPYIEELIELVSVYLI